MEFDVIIADPPWSYQNKKTGGSFSSGSGQKYLTQSNYEIMILPIDLISKKNSVLFLWVTAPFLDEAINIMNYWGFYLKTEIFWHKLGAPGMGYWFRGNVEILLMGIKGYIKPFRCQRENFIESKKRDHSKKPEESYILIEEAISKMENPNKLELYATEERLGWICVGNEIDGKDIYDSFIDLVMI